MTVSAAELGERALRRLGVAIVPVADRPTLTATTTAATVATNALIELGVIAADETPSTADQQLAEDKVAAVHAGLTGQGFVSWAIGGIPLGVAEEYARLTALHLASAFGKQADPQLLALLESRIRRISAVLAAPDAATQAVLDVHFDLAARGKVRWTVQDIPDYVTAPYTLLAANRLAPLFQQQANPADELAAMRSLAQVIALPSSGDRVEAEFF